MGLADSEATYVPPEMVGLLLWSSGDWKYVRGAIALRCLYICIFVKVCCCFNYDAIAYVGIMLLLLSVFINLNPISSQKSVHMLEKNNLNT